MKNLFYSCVRLPKLTLCNFLSENFDIQLLFTFEGLVLCSIIYSLPFMVNPILAGFKNLPHSLKEAAYTLGASKTKTLLKYKIKNHVTT